MNTQERTHPVILIAITIAIAAVMVTAALLLPGRPAQATHVTPEFLAGSRNLGKTCGELEGSGQSWLEFKLEQSKGNLSSGTHTDGTLTVTISNFTFGDTSFDWTSNIGVDGVVVKDGVDGANFYRYDPPTESTGDDGLETPGNQKAISHISFCYDLPDATPTPTPTPTATPTPTSTPTPTTSTPAPTATLAATLAATSTPTPAVLAAVALPDTGQPPAAGSTTAALLLLALGGLLVLGGAGTVVAVTVTRRR